MTGMKPFINRLIKPLSKSRHLYISCLCWLLYIAYEIGVLFYATGKVGTLQSYVPYYAVNIAFFYANARLLHYTFDRYTPFWVRGLLIYLLLLLTTLLLKTCIDVLTAKEHHELAARMKIAYGNVPLNLLRTFYFTILSTFYWAAGHISYFRMQTYKARNAYMQQQVNPHLLFNTLNFIYNGVERKSPETAKCVLLLSDMMRYSLEATEHTVLLPLTQEIEQLQNLLSINRYRYNHGLFVNFEITGDFGHVHISPLLLLTLAENVFKHGYLKDPAAPARIALDISPDGAIRFTTENAKRPKKQFIRSKSLGLENVRTRLEYNYPGRHLLTIREDDHRHYLTLTIQP